MLAMGKLYRHLVVEKVMVFVVGLVTKMVLKFGLARIQEIGLHFIENHHSLKGWCL